MQPDAQAVTESPAVAPSKGRGARSLTARLTLVAALGALPVLLIAGASLLWLFYERIESKFDAFLTAYQQQLIAGAELNANYAGLEADFRAFFPEVVRFAREDLGTRI